MRRRISRPFFLTLGLVSLGLGVIGVFLPLLPTTPFVLLAAFAFSRSSERLYAWLMSHRYYGPLVSNWQRHGVIRPRVKWTAVPLILALAGSSILFLDAPAWAKIPLALVCAGVICFILTRPGAIPDE